jgi:hypothetical protein
MNARKGSLLLLVILGAFVAAAPAIAGPAATIFVLDTTTTTGLDWIEPALSNFGNTFGWDGSMGLLIPDFSDPAAPSWEPYDFGGGIGDWFVEWDTVKTIIPTLAQIGPSVVDVDGLNGIVTALRDTTTYPRIGFGTNIVLITDGGVAATPWGDQDVASALEFRSLANYGYLPDPLFDFTKLNVIVDHGFTDGSGTAMGIYGSNAVVDTGGGNFAVGGTATLVPPTTGETYALLGQVHGSAWDMNQAQLPDPDAVDSFARGFRSVKVGEYGGGGAIGPGDPDWDNGGYSYPPPGPMFPIPEPGTWVLLGVGAILILGARRRRRT